MKLFIHHHYDYVESGPAKAVGTLRGKKLLQLQFIPFEYATPTYGDVVAASKDDEFNNHWAFECPQRGGMPVSKLHAHGGRYAMIVQFVRRGSHTGPWFPGRHDIMSSLARMATRSAPGLVYFAVPDKVRPTEIMRLLGEGHPEFQFAQIHPRPKAARASRPKASRPRARR